MNIEKIIHNGYEEYEQKIKPELPDFKPIFEKWQYIYSENDNKISLVQFTSRMYGEYCWEIYQIKGKTQLFEDVERFKSKEEADKRIKQLFGELN